jgi:NhaP-type Na+/H+ or K+/H+ antiporter
LEFSAELFIETLALTGAVIIISALLSGLIDRTGIPPVAVFLAIGASLGVFGMNIIEISLDSPILRIVATLSLALVLFTDALTLDIGEVRRQSWLALLVLGPGTLLSAALIGLAAWWLLDLSPPQAAILGAALASTDAVLLRGLLRRRDIPGAVRQALRLEGGLNDVVLLPIVLVAMLFLDPAGQPDRSSFGNLGIDLFLLGPGAGIAVGLIAVATLDMVRRRVGMRRDYESLYSLGVAFSAFAAAEALGGSGFLAAFAAGMIISALDVELCDCFFEYGEATAEMFMLFTFVLFGSSLIWSGFSVINSMTLLFAAVVLFGRLPIFLISLAGSSLHWRERLMVAWFGPRGLSSLLVVLLPIFAGLPGSTELFAICSLVVLLSVVSHGGSPLLFDLLPRPPARRTAEAASAAQEGGAPVIIPLLEAADHATPGNNQEQAVQKRCSSPYHDGVDTIPAEETADRLDGEPNVEPEPADSDRISIQELRQLLENGQPVLLLDVRSERSFARSDRQAQGAIRFFPDHIAERAAELDLPRNAWLIAYCA